MQKGNIKRALLDKWFFRYLYWLLKMQRRASDADAGGLERCLELCASDVAVDPTSPIPLYYQLYRVLAHFAHEHHLTVDDQLPTEEFVARTFGVSRPTASRAIREFVHRGQLIRTPGRGSFFQEEQRLDLTLLTNSLSVLDAIQPPTRLETRIIEQRLCSPSHGMAEKLGILENAKIVFLRRLRKIDGRPAMVCDSYLPCERFPGLEDQELVDGSLYATLESTYGVRVVTSERFIEVAEVVTRDVAELLAVPILNPVFVLTGVSSDAAGRSCEYMVSHIASSARFGSVVKRPERDASDQGPSDQRI